MIDLIKKSSNADEARQKLEKKYKLSETQAKAIIEMRLRQLTGLEQNKLREEYDDLQKTIKGYKDLLDSKTKRMNLIKEELLISKKNMVMKEDQKSNMLVVILGLRI